jgi:tRNA-2-methylthio-N6-dimethylallyladenosine synthase
LLKQQQDFSRSLIGAKSTYFWKSPAMPGQLIGRSPWLQSVNVDANASKIGDIINVRITAAGPNSLFAEVAEG